jgi:hypothetical protein
MARKTIRVSKKTMKKITKSKKKTSKRKSKRNPKSLRKIITTPPMYFKSMSSYSKVVTNGNVKQSGIKVVDTSSSPTIHVDKLLPSGELIHQEIPKK